MRNMTTDERALVSGGTSPTTEPMPDNGLETIPWSWWSIWAQLQNGSPVYNTNELPAYRSGD
jgi:hypothetical protein